MRTLLISGNTTPPAPLRDIIERGSTAVQHRRAAETDLSAALAWGADRIVFWGSGQDADVRALADACAARQPATVRDSIVFVTDDAGTALQNLMSNQLFLWPRDEDGLRVAFMTGG
jgi:hypothetical protein